MILLPSYITNILSNVILGVVGFFVGLCLFVFSMKLRSSAYC